jgi:hypothetical protein
MIVHSLVDGEVPEAERRRLLFEGDVFVYSPRPSSRAIAVATQEVLEEIFGGNAVWAQQRMPEEEFTERFTSVALKLNHVLPEVASALVTDFGCDAETTYVGTPHIAATTGMGFIAHGLGVRQHPHRDTWYAASRCQLNWWMPLYDLDASASFAFHPLYWDTPVHNTSSEFDFGQWSEEGSSELRSGSFNPLAQPRALEPIDLTPEIRVSCPAGSVILSSAAHLYSGAPNEALKTNFSLHFTSVSQDDLLADGGPANLDADPRGTSLLTFVRCSDLSPLPRELAERELRQRDAHPRRTE